MHSSLLVRSSFCIRLVEFAHSTREICHHPSCPVSTLYFSRSAYSCTQVTFSPVGSATVAPRPTSPINGLTEWNGLTGRMRLHGPKCISLPSSKILSMLKNGKVLFHFHSRNQLVPFENGKVLFCATLVAPNGEKDLSRFSTYWKA